MSSFKVVSFRGCIEINEGESNEDALKRVEEYLGRLELDVQHASLVKMKLK